jgi:hypothetical protein
MSTIDFKNAWEEALHRALLASQPESELADPALISAAGLPIRSDLRAGAGVQTLTGNWYCVIVPVPSKDCTVKHCNVAAIQQ